MECALWRWPIGSEYGHCHWQLLESASVSETERQVYPEWRTHEVKTMFRIISCSVVLFLFQFPLHWASAQESLNLSFEEPGSAPEKPRGWWVDPGVTLDASSAHTGKCSLRIQSDEKTKTCRKAVQALPTRLVAGRTVSLTGYVSTDKTAAINKNATLSISVFDRSLKETERAESKSKQGTDPGSWSFLKTELSPKLDASSAYIEVQLDGPGTAWFDSLEIEIDGIPYEEAYRRAFGKFTPDERKWFGENISPLQITDPGNAIDDLVPLRQIVGSARLVALGEGTHGTSEFFRMKHRFTRFLATEMGFRYLAIEMGMADVKPLNDFVLTGKGDPSALMKTASESLYQAQEILDLVLWMREFNASGKGPIEFLGIDIGRRLDEMGNVRKFVAKVDPDFLPSLDNLYQQMAKLPNQQESVDENKVRQKLMFQLGDPNESERICRLADELLSHLENSRKRYLRTTSVREVDWGTQNARSIRQFFGLCSS